MFPPTTRTITSMVDGRPSARVVQVTTTPVTPAVPVAQPVQPVLVEPAVTPVIREKIEGNAIVKAEPAVVENTLVPEFSDEHVIAELVAKGYEVRSRVVFSGNRMGYKAVDPFGYKIYIENDLNRYSVVDLSNLTMVESNSAVVVPINRSVNPQPEVLARPVVGPGAIVPTVVKTAMLPGPARGTSYQSSAVVQCRDDNCRFETSTPVASADVFDISGRSRARARLRDDLIAYPFIRLSEIRANINQVEHNTGADTREIRSQAYQIYATKVATLYNDLVRAVRTLESFNLMAPDIRGKLDSSLGLLWMEYDRGVAQNNLSFVIQNQENIRMRNEYYENLFRYYDELATLVPQVKAITGKINTVTQELGTTPQCLMSYLV